MSLKEAVLGTIEFMEETSNDPDCQNNYPALLSCLRVSIRMLQIALKAAGDNPPVPAEVQNFQMMQKAREEFRKVNKEEDDIKMTLLVGGASDGDSFAIGNWPVGARTNISGEVYQLEEDGKLHYEEKKESC